jgi:hypothetical protein
MRISKGFDNRLESHLDPAIHPPLLGFKTDGVDAPLLIGIDVP